MAILITMKGSLFTESNDDIPNNDIPSPSDSLRGFSQASDGGIQLNNNNNNNGEFSPQELLSLNDVQEARANNTPLRMGEDPLSGEIDVKRLEHGESAQARINRVKSGKMTQQEKEAFLRAALATESSRLPIRPPSTKQKNDGNYHQHFDICQTKWTSRNTFYRFGETLRGGRHGTSQRRELMASLRRLSMGKLGPRRNR